MEKSDWTKLKSIFGEVILLPPADQKAFLDEKCGSDDEMRQLLAEMIVSHDDSGDFMEDPNQDFGEIIGENLQDDAQMIGERIGVYQIVEKLGEGGMGNVYLGRRDDKTFENKVAIKILKRGLDTDGLLRRFKQERQTLAQLNHPNIGNLLDGGSTEDGRPYFVMEYIQGVPIDEYCDQNQLDIKQRLAIFKQVCSAVQHAHQNLIIHRDIKPANILVDVSGVPKLLDFGIAKLLAPVPEMQTAGLTVAGQRYFTPDFAPPEQIKGEVVNITGDVYSLGALLYILLSGFRPYYFKKQSPAEISRVICEVIPDAPSRLFKMNQSEAVKNRPDKKIAAENRNLSPEKLGKILAGDLDNIILKALRKDAGRRYQTASQFTDDIERYLGGLPVLARKDTFVYRSSKFVRRHLVGLAATILVFVSLLSSTIIVNQQAEEARKSAETANQTVNYLRDMLTGLNVFDTGKELTITEFLDQAAQDISNNLEDQPAVNAEINAILGVAYASLGEYDKARPMLMRAKELNIETFGINGLAVGKNDHRLAIIDYFQGNMDTAAVLYLNAITIFKQNGDTTTANYATLLNDYGNLLNDVERYDEAVFYLEKALALSRAYPDDPAITVAGTINNLAYSYDSQGDHERAVVHYREALKLSRDKYGNQHREVATILTNLSSSLIASGDTLAAIEMIKEAVDLYKDLLGEDHYQTAIARHNMSHYNYDIGLYATAEKTQRPAVKVFSEVFGEDHLNTAAAKRLLGLILRDSGQYQEAEQFLVEALRIREAKLPENHEATLLVREELAECRRLMEG